MASKVVDRVIFYSTEDGAGPYNLQKAEKLLNEIKIDNIQEINDWLELYNIKLYFDNGLFLSTWEEPLKEKYTQVTNNAGERIRTFFLTINDKNIIPTIENVETHYQESFWHLFNYFQVYKRIAKDSFSKALNVTPAAIRFILSHRNTVKYFDREIRDFLIRFDRAAELLLIKWEEGGRLRNVDYIFPGSLSLEDKESIILNYIELEDANLNYIRLIEHSRDSKDLSLAIKTRLKAKKRSRDLNNQIFEKGTSCKVGVQVSISMDQTKPVAVVNHGLELEVSYSKKFLDEQSNDVALILLFKTLFGFTDHQGLISLVNKQSEMDVIEKILMKSKNEYVSSVSFRKKQNLSLLQILIFDHYLTQQGKSVETLILSFLEEGLNKHYKLENLKFRLPTKGASYLEKIRTLAPELESLLKQYQVFSIEGTIDIELIRFDSTPLSFAEIKSRLPKKYVYIGSDKTRALINYFFSEQSMLHYVEPFKEKYSCLYDLLQHEDVKPENFELYQIDQINVLITDGYLFIDTSNNVKIKNDILIYLIGDLHRSEAISYWHYPREVRDILDEMEREKLIQFDTSLLSKPEVDYFNYYLNKKGFTNGLNIRNKYLHGSNSDSEEKHKQEYHMLLKLITLTLLKIADDLVLYEEMVKAATA